MARPKSVILSKDEKKSVVTGLKAKRVESMATIKSLASARRDADRAYAAAGKEHIAILKVNDKAAVAANKELDNINAQIAAMTASAVAA